jgi:hypothetical protein
VNNTNSLIKALNNTDISKNVRICSFDIKNMYTNIPQCKSPDIIKLALKNSNMNYDTFVTDIQNLMQIILQQNYFQYNGQFYTKTKGLAMAALISDLLTETFIQYIEHNRIIKLLQEYNVTDVHDILIIYNENSINIDKMLAEINRIHKNL